jgi:triphosphatase
MALGLRSSDLQGQVASITRARAGAPPCVGHLADRGPSRVQLIQFQGAVRADECCSALLAIHAAAISRNLECVLSSVDPEGPHQFRVALRRLRVVFRTFRPILRASSAESLVASARRMAAIVGELRDADVLIDDILAPGAASQRMPAVAAALNDWRQEVRGRVRARLLSCGAPAFTAALNHAAQTLEWRRRKERTGERLARELVAAFVEKCGQRVAGAAAALPYLSPEETHDVRKEVKSLRYAVDLADALSLNPDRDLAHTLKRAQDALGFVNDVATLERFAAPLLTEQKNLAQLRDQLIVERVDAVQENIVRASARLQGIVARTHAREWGRG